MKSILGIGNALVDVMTPLPDESVLHQLKLPKGSMTLVDRDFIDQVRQITADIPSTLAAGGSSANTIHGLANLNVRTAFIGKVGRDEYGDFFRKDMENHHIQTIMQESSTDSGRAVALVSPDSERTFATYLGAAVELQAEDLEEDIFRHHHFFHIEGYLVQNRALVTRALQLAKKHGVFTSLDLASYNVVESNLDFLHKMIEDYVDIVFANEEEAKAFTGHEPAEALEAISNKCHITVVKVGKNGSLVKQGEEKMHIPANPAKVIDTTGAGDLYASGFLYGLVSGHDLGACAESGTLLAGKVIEVMGAKIDELRWKDIKRQLKMID